MPLNDNLLQLSKAMCKQHMVDNLKDKDYQAWLLVMQFIIKGGDYDEGLIKQAYKQLNPSPGTLNFLGEEEIMI